MGKVARDTAEENLDLIVQTRRKLEENGVTLDQRVFNVYEFILLLQHDLSALMCDMVRNHTRLGTSLYARLLILLIYETSEKLQKVLLAKDFREEYLAALDVEDNRSLIDAHKRASDLFKRCNSKYGAVRRGLAAHWDVDPDERQRLIDTAEVRPIADLAIEMLGVLLDVTRLLSQYFERFRDTLYGQGA